MPIPIIDIFAGPGGLGEGFSSLTDERGERVFKIGLSIEKDPYAHQTLKLRSFFRQFPVGNVPDEYYQFVRSEIDLEKLYDKFPDEARLADEEAWCATLGEPDEEDKNAASDEEVDHRIRSVLGNERRWVLIGGPPCQAYSLVGRSRRQERILDEERDKRVGLYKEYLRIIAVHNPAVFVMENVKGLLSARTEQEHIFPRIIADLSDPIRAYQHEEVGEDIADDRPTYRIFSLTVPPRNIDMFGNPEFDPRDFIIKAEEYGVPQKRHRVILLGIRSDINVEGNTLLPREEVSLESIIGNLPKIRSGITREFSHYKEVRDEEGKLKKKRYYNKVRDSFEEWKKRYVAFNETLNQDFGNVDEDIVYENLKETLGKEFIQSDQYDLDDHHPLRSWFRDERLMGIIHHISRKHLIEDINRYLFAARFTKLNNAFPRLDDYRTAGNDLMPDHENAESGKFTDRFRVQLPNQPATTVTSHISKDGHYFIHYDPNQARSLTVREAARIQTFPDNYYFCGGRTQQFHQVGNAVPPYLAYQIGNIVAAIFEEIDLNNVPVNAVIGEI